MFLFSLALVLLNAAVLTESCAKYTNHKDGRRTAVGCAAFALRPNSTMCRIPGNPNKPYPYCCEKPGPCSELSRRSPSISPSTTQEHQACMKTTKHKDGSMSAVGCPTFQLASNSTMCRIPGNPKAPYPGCCEQPGPCKKPKLSCMKTTKHKDGRITAIGCPLSITRHSCIIPGNLNKPYPYCCEKVVPCSKYKASSSSVHKSCMKTTKHRDGSMTAVGCPTFQLGPNSTMCRVPGNPYESYPGCCEHPGPCTTSSVPPSSVSPSSIPPACMKTTKHKDGSISGVGCPTFQLSPNSTMCRVPGNPYEPYPGCCEHPGPCTTSSVPPSSVPPSSVPQACMKTTKHKDGSISAVGCPTFQLSPNSTMCRLPGNPNEPYPECCEHPGPCTTSSVPPSSIPPSSVTPSSIPPACMKTTKNKDGSISAVGCPTFQLSPNSTICRVPGNPYAPYPGCCEHPGPCTTSSVPSSSIPIPSIPQACMKTTKHKDGSVSAVGCPTFQLGSNSTMCRIAGNPNAPYPNCCEHPGPCRNPKPACMKTTKHKDGRITAIGCPLSITRHSCITPGNPNKPYPHCCEKVVPCSKYSASSPSVRKSCMKTTKHKDGSISAVGCPAFQLRPNSNMCRIPGNPNKPYPHCCEKPGPCSSSSMPSPSIPPACMKTTRHKDGSMTAVGCPTFQLGPNSTMCRVPGDPYEPYPGCCEHPGPCTTSSVPPSSIHPSSVPPSSVPQACMKTTKHKDGSISAVGCPTFQLSPNSTMCRLPGNPNESHPGCCEHPGPCTTSSVPPYSEPQSSIPLSSVPPSSVPPSSVSQACMKTTKHKDGSISAVGCATFQLSPNSTMCRVPGHRNEPYPDCCEHPGPCNSFSLPPTSVPQSFLPPSSVPLGCIKTTKHKDGSLTAVGCPEFQLDSKSSMCRIPGNPNAPYPGCCEQPGPCNSNTDGY